MHLLTAIAELASVPGPVVLAIGVFDGVHLGHQAVLRRALKDAEILGGTAVALTFDPHPARVLRPDKAPRLLTSTPHKLRLMRELGVRHLLVQKFDKDFAASEPRDFLQSLSEACQPLRQIVVGHQWAFGRGRSGNIELIREFGENAGFEAVELEPVEVEGHIVSSTRIRKAIEEGDLLEAKKCLGRDFTILGTVTQGRQVGRTIGFPTANLRAHNEQFPPDGVYAVAVRRGAQVIRGVANIGVRPTLEKAGERVLEVHLLDFADDVYGEDLEVVFTRFIRPEKRFAGLEELKAQIAQDAAEARA